MFLLKALGYEAIMRDLESQLIDSKADELGNAMELRKVEVKIRLEEEDLDEDLDEDFYEEEEGFEEEEIIDKSYIIQDEPIYLLKVICPSTGKEHVLRVPPDMKSCEEARRWTLYDSESRFNFIVEA